MICVEYLNPIAELDSPDSGNIVKPEVAHKIKNLHNFCCPDHDCLDEMRLLFPVKSKLGNYFFKHRPNCSHDISPETLLHKLAVKWFEKRTDFELPRSKSRSKAIVNLNTEKTELEYRKLERIIPDVKLTTTGGFEFAIEIVVTSDITGSKNKFIEEFNLPTVRIDLEEFYYQNQEKCRTDYDFVQEHLDRLLTNITLKNWAIEPSTENADQSPGSNGQGCLLVVAFVGFIYLIIDRFKN